MDSTWGAFDAHCSRVQGRVRWLDPHPSGHRRNRVNTLLYAEEATLISLSEQHMTNFLIESRLSIGYGYASGQAGVR